MYAGRGERSQELVMTVQPSTHSYRKHRCFDTPLTVTPTEVVWIEEGESAVIESFKGMGSKQVRW